jgi:hypothetical protein
VVVDLSLPAVWLALSVATAAALSPAPIAGSLTDRFVAQRAVICARFLQGIGFAGHLLEDRVVGMAA